MNTPNHADGSQGIWIPRAIWLTRGLSLREKALLALFNAHVADADDRVSNAQLMRLLDVGERQIRACLAALREKGFIAVRLGARRERIIRVTGRHARPDHRPPRRPGRRRKQASRR